VVATLLSNLAAPAIGLVAGLGGVYWGSRLAQRQWVSDKKRQEYAELLESLFEFDEQVVKYQATRIKGPNLTFAQLKVARVIHTRLFIQKAVAKLALLERWSQVEKISSLPLGDLASRTYNMPQLSMTDFNKEFYALIDTIKTFAAKDLKIS